MLDIARLARIGLAPPLLQRLAEMELQPGALPMRVSAVQRDSLTLHDGAAEHTGRALPALLQRLALEGDEIAVGDWVLVRRNAHDELWAHERVPPLTQIVRRLHDGRHKVTRTVIAANVDTALLVMGLDGDFSERRLERYLALTRLAGISAVVVLTKADLCADVAARERAVQALLPADAALVSVNALSHEARERLAPWLGGGRTLVMLGSSGTGKSTLTNALIGAGVQRTGANRADDSRGRHTTTSRSLHVTPEGACIVDTPGLRTLRLDGEAGSIAGAFDDIATLALRCRFRDCRHEHEPGCAVRDAVAAERLRSFSKLRREAERDTWSALQRKQQVALWKSRGRAARAVAKSKRG